MGKYYKLVSKAFTLVDMALSREQVEKFQAIYRESFGKEISYADVLDRGYKLVRLIKIIYQPITQKEYDDLQERRAKRI